MELSDRDTVLGGRSEPLDSLVQQALSGVWEIAQDAASIDLQTFIPLIVGYCPAHRAWIFSTLPHSEAAWKRVHNAEEVGRIAWGYYG